MLTPEGRGCLHEIAEFDLERMVASNGEACKVIWAQFSYATQTVIAQTLMSASDTDQDLLTTRRYL